MKINRMAEENLTPSWAFNSKTEAFFDKAIKPEEINRLANMSNEISEEEITIEKDKIEVSASAKSNYHYNANWSESTKSELKEYALACGMNMDNFKSIEPSKISSYASSNTMVKTASATSGLVLSDPFKLDTVGNKEHMDKAEWENITKEAKLSDKPTMNGIVPVRGGENYLTNSESKVAKGQNSITDPNAIGKLAESSKEDNGERLRRENKEKEESKKTRHNEWQEAKVASLQNDKALPNRSVFPTESLNAQPGIRGNVFDFTTVPEKTEGEKIREANEDRKKNIRGNEKAKYDFSAQKAPTRSISEDFSSELKKALNK
jgi:hypothetical protein